MIRIKTITNFLSKEECKKIITENSNINLEQASIHDSNSNYELVIDKKIRDSKIRFIEDQILETKIVSELKNQIVIKGYDFIGLENIQFTKYNQNGHYKWHTDSDPKNPKNNRFYSVVVPLNDDYENGNLLIKDIDNTVYTMEKSVGSMHIFLSSLRHTVTPVSEGVRYSLVSWLSLKQIENLKKSLL